MELTTISNAKAYLGIASATFDSVITRMIEGAEQTLRAWCDRPDGWTKTTHTETFDADGQSRINLAYTPIDSTASFVVTLDSNTISSDGYTVDYVRGIIGVTTPWYWPRAAGYTSSSMVPTYPIGQGFQPQFRQISVAYTGGYTAPVYTAQPVLEQACLMVVSYLWTMRGKEGMNSESLGSYSYTKGAGGGWTDLQKQVTDMIGFYDNSTGV